MNARNYIDKNLQDKKIKIDQKHKNRKLLKDVLKAETLFTYYWWDNY